ncbi:MAG: hypothetical protein Q9220_007712 [cf. Caloplaca sp. 1 TL-2023]
MSLVESPPSVNESAPSIDSSKPSKKRKRNTEAQSELEVNISAPEPPSKKALRKAKKEKVTSVSTTSKPVAPIPVPPSTNGGPASPAPKGQEEPTSKRSPHGIWIGNLPYIITKTDLQTFFTNNTSITESEITRIHIPMPTPTSSHARNIRKPQNKGFAYIDFSTPSALASALEVSETLLQGRRVLIKDAHNFEGRPEKKVENGDSSAQRKPKGSDKPPSKRIFVGNLAFDTDKEELDTHFTQCGEVSNVHLATFEDSGKCKGYAWITFRELEGAESAARGYTIKQPTNSESDEEEEDEEDVEAGDLTAANMTKQPKSKEQKRKLKPRKWWTNTLKGRLLKLEFAEDASVRYKKRFGKDKDANARPNGGIGTKGDEVVLDGASPSGDAEVVASKPDSDKKKHVRIQDAGKADSRVAKPRLTGGMVASEGKKVTFD